MTERIAIYPGTFDPITIGHLEIIQRASALADKLIIAIASDTPKQTMFTLQERVKMVEADVADLKNLHAKVEVVSFSGLLVNFAKDCGASILIRGLRAASDFEYEFQMSGMNSKLAPDVQTVFLPASEKTHFIASSFVKEIARLGGDVSAVVSDNVAKILKERS